MQAWIQEDLTEQEQRVLVKTVVRMNQESEVSAAALRRYFEQLTPIQTDVLAKLRQCAQARGVATQREVEAFLRCGL